ncbi:hypothetical protein KM043_005547 [Ampulex compressa]|nr:hypothetical protein KM043_005547 [Ampulex compressa]
MAKTSRNSTTDFEELQSYRVSTSQLMLYLPRILRGPALQWYRNQRSKWNSWDDFLRAFRERYLSPSRTEELKRKIENRLQRPGEPARAFEDSLCALMRYHGGMTENQQIYKLYDNLPEDYQFNIGRGSCRTMDDLLNKADEYERLIARKKRRVQSGISIVQVIEITPGKLNDCFARTVSSRVACLCHQLPESESSYGSSIASPSEQRGNITDSRLFVSFCVAGREFKALVDTGATRTYLRDDVAHWCRARGGRSLTTDLDVQVMNGSWITITEELQLTATVERQMVSVHCLTIPSLVQEAWMF